MSEGPHDVLAAEEFVVPAPDPDLRVPPRLPDDPTGTSEAHDVLAAEEFPMPAVHHAPKQPASMGRRRGVLGAALLALWLLRRRRR